MDIRRDEPISIAEARALRRGAVSLAWWWEIERIAAELGLPVEDVANEDIRLRTRAYEFEIRFGREQTLEEFVSELAAEHGVDERFFWAQLRAIEASESHGHR